MSAGMSAGMTAGMTASLSTGLTAGLAAGATPEIAIGAGRGTSIASLSARVNDGVASRRITTATTLIATASVGCTEVNRRGETVHGVNHYRWQYTDSTGVGGIG